MRIIAATITIGLLIALSSCEIINPEEQVPSYIHIEKIDLSTDYGSEGSNSHNIVDAWVYVNDKFIGGYELPATFPVLASGEVNLKVRAGIRNSGATALRLDYPFYNFYENAFFQLSEDSVSNAEPEATYFDDLTFEWLEGFEGSTTSLEENENSVELTITNNEDEVFEGNGSAKIELTTAEAYFSAVTTESYTLPKQGSDVYLEMDYKTSGYIEVRLISNEVLNIQNTSIIVLYPTDDLWKKIYVDLGSTVTRAANALTFQIQIICYSPNGQEQSVSYLDNIKLIHPGS